VFRSRALTLRHLSDSTSVEWLERFVSLTDAAIVRRLIALDGRDDDTACWCFFGTAGRGESFTTHMPQTLVIANDDHAVPALREQRSRISEALAGCGFLPRSETPFDADFHVATLREWQARYRDWFREPVRTVMYRARPLFDLRPVHGYTPLWSAVEACAIEGADPAFLLVLANDCLASLPPLTFFQDAVLDTSGEQADVFRLDESALRPLVDVGRVFGLATKRVVGTSTVERLNHAADQHPAHAHTCAEAAETFRILLRQQARVGIAQGTTGSELPPSALSRHDRHVLKSGFRSILALIEFTRSAFWLESA
jgi:CBS domain-containing protein